MFDAGNPHRIVATSAMTDGSYAISFSSPAGLLLTLRGLFFTTFVLALIVGPLFGFGGLSHASWRGMLSRIQEWVSTAFSRAPALLFVIPVMK